MRYISAPIGGFGNHVRWLMLLDPSYDIGYQNKVEFICDKIYGQDRSWHNWLNVEWQYRSDLNKLIIFEHNYNPAGDIKKLVLTIDPDLAYRCYLKFNSNLNNNTVDQFKELIKKANDHNIVVSSKHANSLAMSADILYRPVLDPGFYQTLINWFELEDRYAEASIIHQHWYQAHQRAEKEFVRDITNIYK